MKIELSTELDTRRWLPLGGLLIGALICLVVYWPGLHGPMLFDDFPQLGKFFESPSGKTYTLTQVLWSDSGLLGRPVSMLTFWANSVLTPDNLAAWKLTNLIIHLLCGILAGLLAMELFSAAHSARGVEPGYLGAFVGVAWLLHPLQVSTVLYTVQRMTELAALFMFAGLYAFAISRRRQNATFKRTASGLLILSVATVLAVFAKENGLLLPFLALAIELLLFRGTGTDGAARAIKYYFGSLCALALIGTLLLLAWRPQFFSGGYAFRDFTLEQRLLSEPRILFDYLSMLLWPTPGSMGFFHDDVVVSTGILHPLSTLLSLLGLSGLAASAWFARKRFPLYAIGIAIFLIGQSMESSVIALRLMFEHRNYLPGFGVILAVTDLVSGVLANRPRALHATLAGSVLLGLIIALGIRVTYWSSSLSFYQQAARIHPASNSAVAGLAQVYLNADKPELAARLLAGRQDLGSQLQLAYIQCLTTGTLPAAELGKLLQHPMQHLESYPVTGLTLLGAAGIRNQCRFSDAAYSRLIDRAAGLDSTVPDLRYMLYLYSGYYHQRLNQLPQAIAATQAAHRLSPTTPVPLILSARWYLQAGKPEQAEYQLQKAMEIDRKYHAGFAADIAALQAQLPATSAQHPPTGPH